MSTRQEHNPVFPWKETYSVGVEEIDDQHKELTSLINSLIELLHEAPMKESIQVIFERIVAFKTTHFAFEEKYFKEFQYEGTEEHIKAHRAFDAKITDIQNTHKDDAIALAYALVDYLEDWFVDHLLVMDKEYMTCFHEHGLH